MSPLTERMRQVADDILKGDEISLHEIEMLLREASYTQDRCFAMLSFITDVLRQEELENERRNNEDKDK
jgi:hypothetical protein